MLIRYQHDGRWYEAEWPPQRPVRSWWRWWAGLSLLAWGIYAALL